MATPLAHIVDLGSEKSTSGIEKAFSSRIGGTKCRRPLVPLGRLRQLSRKCSIIYGIGPHMTLMASRGIGAALAS